MLPKPPQDLSVASERDFYVALAYTVRDHVMKNWMRTAKVYYNKDPKVRAPARFSQRPGMLADLSPGSMTASPSQLGHRPNPLTADHETPFYPQYHPSCSV